MGIKTEFVQQSMPVYICDICDKRHFSMDDAKSCQRGHRYDDCKHENVQREAFYGNDGLKLELQCYNCNKFATIYLEDEDADAIFTKYLKDIPFEWGHNGPPRLAVGDE